MGDMEAVATFTPDGEGSWLAIDIGDKVHWSALRDEIMAWADLAFAADGDKIGTITLIVRKAGYVAALPEFEGW